jgi:hypothetical protein
LLLLILSIGIVLIAFAESGVGGAWGWFQKLGGDGEPPATVLAARAPIERRPLPGLDLALLQGVRDDASFRNIERPALAHVVATLQSMSDDDIARASIGVLTYRQVFHQPQLYRGEPMKLSGIVRRAHKLGPKPDQEGEIQSNPEQPAEHDISYWQLWVFKPGASDPLVVFCPEMPAGFPEGMEIEEKVELHAVFFKRLAYAAQDRVRTAPMLAAKNVTWTPHEASPGAGRRRMTTRDFLYSTLGTILLALAVISYVVWRTEKLRGPKKPLIGGQPQSPDHRLATRLHLRSLETMPLERPAPGDVVLDEEDAPPRAAAEQGATERDATERDGA